MRKHFSILAAFPAALALALVSMLGGCASTHESGRALPPNTLSQVHKGLTEQQVRSLLGEPTQALLRPTTGGAMWNYQHTVTHAESGLLTASGSSQLKNVQVSFGKDGRVTSCVVTSVDNKPVSGFFQQNITMGVQGGGGSTTRQSYCDQ